MQCGVYIVVTRIPFVAGCFYNALRGTYFLLISVYIGVRGTYYNVIAAVFTMLWWEHTFLLALFISAPRCSRNNAAASLPVLATVWSNVSPAMEQIMCHRSPTTSYSAHVTYNNTTVKHITMFKRNKLFSIGNKGKGMIFLYSAIYHPMDRSESFTLHTLADLFILSSTQLHWEAFSHAAITAQRIFTHISNPVLV